MPKILALALALRHEVLGLGLAPPGLGLGLAVAGLVNRLAINGFNDFLFFLALERQLTQYLD